MILQPNVVGVPNPVPSADSRPYWDGCAAGELRIQRCASCGHVNVLPSRWCAACAAPSMRWVATSGSGSLYSWTVVWRPQIPAFTVPYAPAIVMLDEGAAVMSAVVGCAVDELTDGLRLTVMFVPTDHGMVVPFFRPAATAPVTVPSATAPSTTASPT